jgi:uncharacterized membrane protein
MVCCRSACNSPAKGESFAHSVSMPPPAAAGYLTADCGEAVRSWRLCRNCRLTPARLIAATSIAPLLGIGPALLFLLLGFPYIALFAVIQGVAVVAAVLAYGRHATDGERLSVGQGRVSLTVHDGLRTSTESWGVEAVRLWRAQTEDGEITLYAGGRPYRLGAHVRAERRRALEREIRQALEVEWARGRA